MLTGGVGIGFWVWDEWNNLKVEHIIVAIFVIGIVPNRVVCSVLPDQISSRSSTSVPDDCSRGIVDSRFRPVDL